MGVIETQQADFLGEPHAPVDNPNYFSFVFPLRYVEETGEFEVCLMRRASGRAGGDWISTVGGHIRITPEAVTPSYLASEGRRELREEVGHDAKIVTHRGRIAWQNDEQGNCRGEVFVATGLHGNYLFDDDEGALLWVSLHEAILHPEVHPMIRRILEDITVQDDFYDTTIPTELSLWTRND